MRDLFNFMLSILELLLEHVIDFIGRNILLSDWLGWYHQFSNKHFETDDISDSSDCLVIDCFVFVSV